MQIKNNLLLRLSDLLVVSGKVMTVFSLIVIPILVILSHYYIYEQARSVGHFELDPKTKKITFKYPTYFAGILNIITYLQITVFIFILVVYPPYPFPASIERYFKERGYRRAVDEYEFIKKVLYVTIPLILLFGIWSTEAIVEPVLDNTVQLLPKDLQLDKKYISDSLIDDDLYVDYPALLLMLVFVATIFKMICIRVRKDFRLYFARGCFVICEDEKNEVKKMRYFTMGLNSYNDYLRRLISLEISDLKTKVYSKIASSCKKEKAEITNNIISVFVTDKNMEAYTLEPVRQLADFMKKSMEEFLTKQHFLDKLKEWTAISSVIITMIVSLFPVLLKF